MTSALDVTLEQLDEQQRIAVERALSGKDRLVVITGPAGSGKTMLMRFIAEKLRDQGEEVELVAPTGKAARRIREATGLPAKTIHMLLEYTAPRDINPKTGKPYGDTYPRRTRENKLTASVIIGDEYAMVTHDVNRNLIDALANDCRLILFGDVMQLPPIETNPVIAAKPSPFAQMLKDFDGIVLEKVHRQTGDSGILYNAQRVLKGIGPQTKPDFNVMLTNGPVDALITAIGHADFSTLENQVITPTNRTWIGTHRLNQLMQDILMSSDRHTIKLKRKMYNGKTLSPDLRIGVGDKVRMSKNWYDLECSDGTRGVFNGETGIVTEITELEEVVVDFEDRTCAIPPAMQVMFDNRVMIAYPHEDLFLSYAITTHGAQGSEYKNVVYVMNNSVLTLCNRRNLYTGLTRAREHVTLITDTKALSMALLTKEPRVFSKPTYTPTKKGK